MISGIFQYPGGRHGGVGGADFFKVVMGNVVVTVVADDNLLPVGTLLLGGGD